MDKQVTKEQIGSIVALLVAGKVPFEDAQAFIDRYKSMPSAKKGKLPVGHYFIHVKSVANPTTTDLDKFYACLSECWDDQGHPENPNYAPCLHQSLRGVTPSLGKKVACLLGFDEPMTVSQVVDYAASNGYRLAFPCEREAFVRRYARLLLDERGGDLKIIDLGCHSPGRHPHVPLIEGIYKPMGWDASLNACLLNNDPFGTEFSFLLIKH